MGHRNRSGVFGDQERVRQDEALEPADHAHSDIGQPGAGAFGATPWTPADMTARSWRVQDHSHGLMLWCVGHRGRAFASQEVRPPLTRRAGRAAPGMRGTPAERVGPGGASGRLARGGPGDPRNRNDHTEFSISRYAPSESLWQPGARPKWTRPWSHHDIWSVQA